MPVYEFQCDDCGVKFERLFKSISTADNAAPCPECGEPSRKLVSAVNHTFKHPESQKRGPLPPSTGTSDDWNYDKAIGDDAAKKWAAIDERKGRKETVLQDAAQDGVGAGMDHLVRTRGEGQGAGDYRVIGDQERQVVNARRTLAAEVAKTGFTESQKATTGSSKD